MSDHEAEVGVKQNTAAAVGADLAAARAAQDAFQTVRSGKPALSAAAVTVADSNAKAFLGNASAVLRRFPGEPWNQR